MTLTSVHAQLLQYLIGLTIASGLGLGATNLGGLPTPVVAEALAGAADDGRADPDRGHLLGSLAADPHAEIRAAVADAIGHAAPWSDRDLDILTSLVVDPDANVRSAAAASFPSLLERAPLPRRLEAVATWATGEQEPQRLAAARGLGNRLPVPAADVVLAHLVEDPSARVRRGALEAVRVRFADAPQLTRELTETAVADPSRRVRDFARRLFAGATRAA